MHEPRQTKVDLNHVINQSSRNREYFREYYRAVHDSDRDERQRVCQCRLCYYLTGRIGGAMTTKALCGLCGCELHFSNTCVDVLCPDCARKHRLCLHCGGDMEMSRRRKL